MIAGKVPYRSQRCEPAAASPASQNLDLLIVSEVRFFREALAELLKRDPAVTRLEVCADLDDAVIAVVSQRMNMVILDASFRDGLNAARRLRDVGPDHCVVALALAETTDNVIAWGEA